MPEIGLVPVYNLSLSAPIFDSLKIDYSDFETWWKKISREGRRTWALDKPDKKLEAFLILFLLHLELKNYITLSKLQKARIMLRAPQSVMEISDERCRQILKMGAWMNVLLSIKPKYTESIKSGLKKYEFRRKIFRKAGASKVFIYSTSPVKKIIGAFDA